jgi:cbb3-type cytochrome oxidase maturation protein
MSVIYLLLGISIIVAIIFFIAFIISVRSGQYDDSYTPSVRMLFDDELVKENTNSRGTKQTVKSELKSIEKRAEKKEQRKVSSKSL